MCRYSPGAAEGAWEDPQAHGLELDAGQYLFIQFLAVCSLRVKYMSIALTEYLVVIKRLGSLGSQLVSTKLG